MRTPIGGPGGSTHGVELGHDHIVLLYEIPKAGGLQLDGGLCGGILGDASCSEPEQAEGEAC